MLPRPDRAAKTDRHAPSARHVPLVHVIAREDGIATQLCAMAPSGRLCLERSNGSADADADAALICGGGLRAEDRMWLRGVIANTKSAYPVIIVGDNVTDEIACELIEAGASDVLDWATLTSTSLSRAVHLVLARGAQFSTQINAAAPIPEAPITLLQECASAIIMVDPDGIVKFANRDAEDILGVPAGSLTGAPFALAMNGAGKKDIVLDGPNGREVKAEVRVVDTEHGGVPMRVVTLQDVTLRRLLEQHFAA